MTKRVLTAEEAAREYAPSLSTFYEWVSKGVMPKPLEGTRCWFRDAIEQRLREKSGLAVSSGDAGNDAGEILTRRTQQWRPRKKR